MANFFSGAQEGVGAGTAITVVIPPINLMIPRINRFCYTAGATEHTATILRPIGRTTTTAASASGVSTLVLDDVSAGKTTANAEEDLAADDYVAWPDQYGVWHTGILASISANTITLTAALTEDVNRGAYVYVLHELGRATHLQVKLPASTRVEIIGPIQAGFGTQSGVQTSRTGLGDPLVLSIDNITNAGKLHYVLGNYATSENQVTI